MLSDIRHRKVDDIALAVVPSDDDFWQVYLLNLKEGPIANVLISSKGYGSLEGEEVKTSQLRYFYDEIAAQSATPIEPIPAQLLHIANEYWLSFQWEGYMFDKKYVFVEGSIQKAHLTTVPLLEKKGVLIR